MLRGSLSRKEERVNTLNTTLTLLAVILMLLRDLVILRMIIRQRKQ